MRGSGREAVGSEFTLFGGGAVGADRGKVGDSPEEIGVGGRSSSLQNDDTTR